MNSAPEDRATSAARTATLAAGLALAAACASVSVEPDQLRRLETGEVDPCRVVFVCQGMLHDLGASWNVELQEQVFDAGAVGIVVTYWSDPTGVWFNWGARAPGGLVTRLAADIRALHRESTCARPLRLYAAGFSNGCEALLHAMSNMRATRFEKAVFMHSSSFAWSYEVDKHIAHDRLGELRHYWSPIDFTTIFAPLGAGQFGLASRSPFVENKMRFAPHLAFLVREGLRTEVLDYLLEPSSTPDPAPPHTCDFGPRLADYLARVAELEPSAAGDSAAATPASAPGSARP